MKLMLADKRISGIGSNSQRKLIKWRKLIKIYVHLLLGKEMNEFVVIEKMLRNRNP